MERFTKTEVVAVSLILLAIGLVTFFNLQTSILRARDQQRKDDLSNIQGALMRYYQDYGFFPPSDNGRIKACKGANFDKDIAEIKKEGKFDRSKFFDALVGCEYGKDGINDIINSTNSSYMPVIPSDPKTNKGVSYLYLSDGTRFQIYAYLEAENGDDEYNLGVIKRNLSCGNKICSFGKSYADTPLDKSIEEYENELLLKSKLNK